MGFLDIFQRRETRNLNRRDWIHALPGSRPIGPGVSAASVLAHCATASACEDLLAGTLACQPLHVFKRGANDTRERDKEHPAHRLLHGEPEAREMMVRDPLRHGNHFSKIDRGSDGALFRLRRMDPSTVTVERLANGRLRYREGGQTWLEDEVLHIRGPSENGLTGQSVFDRNRGVFALALQQVEASEAIARNGVFSSGAFVHPNKLSLEAREKIKATLEGSFAGASNAGKIMVLDEGVQYSPFKLNAQEAEHMAARRFMNEEIARVYGVPGSIVGVNDRAPFATAEAEARAFIRSGLAPLANRIEAALNRSLFTPEERETYFIEHDLNGLLRGDTAARFEAYRVAREIGAMSANDIRRLENQSPVPGGDNYHVPANWTALEAVNRGD
jgi:HK97 family phage portal protein